MTAASVSTICTKKRQLHRREHQPAAPAIASGTPVHSSRRARQAAPARRARAARTTSIAPATTAIPTSSPTIPGRLAELQAGERQRAVGDELARRHPDDARDREHQHQREREQRVDGAVGDAILREQRGDREVHRRTGASISNGPARRSASGPSRSDQVAYFWPGPTCRSRSSPSRERGCRGRCGRWRSSRTRRASPTTFAFSSASRSAARNSFVPGLPFFSASGIALAEQQVGVVRVAAEGRARRRISSRTASTYSAATFLIGLLSGSCS